MEAQSRLNETTKDFWGDQLGPRHNYLRVVYNNVNGLMMGDYMAKKKKIEKNKKKMKYL